MAMPGHPKQNGNGAFQDNKEDNTLDVVTMNLELHNFKMWMLVF